MLGTPQLPRGPSLLGTLAVGLVAVAAVLRADRAGAADAPPRLRVLVYSGLNNHDWASTTPVIARMLAACDRFGPVDVAADPAHVDAATLARYDLVVSNWTPYPDTRRTWPPETEAAFLDFVRRGGGFVVIHAAACTFQVWPEFQRLIALTWQAEHTGHGAYHTFPVSVGDRRHPIARGLTDFYTTDELYHNMVSLTDQPFDVVFRAFSAKDKAGTGRDEPVLVCTTLGQGRGANLVLGHDVAAMGAGFRALLLRSAEWAATGAVTLPPPAIWPSTPAALAAAEVDVEATFAALPRYRHGDPRQPLHDLQQLVVYANSRSAPDAEAFARGLAGRLASLLTSPVATPEAKAFVCGQLAGLATDADVPALSALLGDADRNLATAALGAIARVPGPAADRVLRRTAESAADDLRLGAINALGERRDVAATAALVALLAGPDAARAGAAVAALGKIGSAAAVAALQEALASATGRRRAEVADACLVGAERLLAAGARAPAAALYVQLLQPQEAEPVRMAALRGLVLADPERGTRTVRTALASGDPAMESAAIQLVPQIAGRAATAQFVQALDTVPAPVQALLLGALAARGDATAGAAAETAAAGDDPAVRLAALKALATLGGRTSVALLLTRAVAATGSAEGTAARDSLVRLRARHVDETLAGFLAAADASTRAEAVRLLAARQAAATVRDLRRATADPEAGVRREAWKALGSLAATRDAKPLLDLLVLAGDDERDEAERAVTATLKRADRPDVRPVLRRLAAVSAPAARASLLRVASAVGDDRALPALRQALADGDSGVRDAAVRGLAAWPTPAPLDDLVGLARQAHEPVHRVLALRAAIRLSSQAAGRTPEQTTRLVADLLQLAGEAAERRAILAELGRCPTLEALRLSQTFVADPALANEAGLAVTQIAAAIHTTHRAEVVAALIPLLAAGRDPAVIACAGKQLTDILQPVNLALAATASSPDGIEPDGASGGDKAANDGDPRTYWDEVDNAESYRLRVTFREPQQVASIHILWHPYEQHQARNFDILCDGTLAGEVRNAACVDNEVFVPLAPVRCTTVELVIPGRNGLVSPALHELQVFGPFAPAAPPSAVPVAPPSPPRYGWQQTDTSLALLNHDRVVWQWNVAPDLAKPFVHPVALTDGTVLTAPGPADHPWHRALWFSWKVLNGINYWEEDPTTGKAQGVTEVLAVRASPNADGSARIELELSYHPPSAPPVLTERRVVDMSAPDAQGVYRIDWRATFAAGGDDVRLEGGTAGGGYAGLSVRVSQASGDWVLIASDDRRDTPTDGDPANAAGLAANTHGKPARWADFSLVDNVTGTPGGIAILDHPSNPRHPSLWHNILAAGGGFGYFSPALLWRAPYTLGAGQSFALRYRVVVHPGRADPATIETEWRAFAAAP